MHATRTVPDHPGLHTRWKWRPTGFMTPLPPLRRPSPAGPRTRGGLQPWSSSHHHPEAGTPLRDIVGLILWLLVVLAMMLLFAEFWR